jgi:hypothetical protein
LRPPLHVEPGNSTPPRSEKNKKIKKIDRVYAARRKYVARTCSCPVVPLCTLGLKQITNDCNLQIHGELGKIEGPTLIADPPPSTRPTSLTSETVEKTPTIITTARRPADEIHYACRTYIRARRCGRDAVVRSAFSYVVVSRVRACSR